MKKFIYLSAWLLLTITEAILGYQTAIQINLVGAMAIVYSIGFAMLSIPLKMIYERIVEKNYRSSTIYGNIIFFLFAGIWCTVVYLAHSGIADLRQSNMKLSQFEKFKESKAGTDQVKEIKNGWDYRLEKQRLKAKITQDSSEFILYKNNIEQVRSAEMKAINDQGKNGFLFFNIVLILSAAICLSMAFDEETIKQRVVNELVYEKRKYTKKDRSEAFTDEARAEVVLAEGERYGFKCSCGRSDFPTQNSINAHLRFCKGSTYEKIIVKDE